MSILALGNYDSSLAICLVYCSYLYGVNLEANLSFDDAEELLEVGDKYEVASLVDECGRAMASTMDRQTCVRAAVVGHLRRVAELKRKVCVRSWYGNGERVKHTLFNQALDYIVKKKVEELGPEVDEELRADLAKHAMGQ